MINAQTITNIAHCNKLNAFESIERLIEKRCDEILKVTGKGNFDHPLMTGFSELQSLNDKIADLKNLVKELHKLN